MTSSVFYWAYIFPMISVLILLILTYLMAGDSYTPAVRHDKAMIYSAVPLINWVVFLVFIVEALELLVDWSDLHD